MMAPRGVLTLRRAVVVAMLSEAVALGGALAALAVVSRTRNAQEFGAYALLTRLMAVLQPVCLLGVGVTLPRLLPRSTPEEAPSLILSAVLLVLPPIGIVGLISLHAGVGGAVLRDAVAVVSLPVLGVMLTGSVLHAVAYAALRGLLLYRTGSALFALNMGLVPLVCAVLTDGVAHLALALGLAWALISSTVLIGCIRHPMRPRPGPLALGRAGIGRVPGEFALFGITAAPPVLVSQYESVAAAGTASLAMTVLTSVGAAVVPVSAILLPHVSARLAAGGVEAVRLLLRRLCRLWLLVAPVSVIVLEIGVRWLLPLVFGERGTAALPLARVLLLATPGFALFVMLRSFVDAASARASTMVAAVEAFAMLLGLFLVLHWLGMQADDAAAVAAVASMWLLGLTVLRQAFAVVETRGPRWALRRRTVGG